MRNIIIILLAVASLSGCTLSLTGLEQMTSSDISLTWKGDLQISYDPETYQLGYSSRNEYRVYDDKISDWFSIRCSEKPVSNGQTLQADVSWTKETRTMEFEDLEFTVVQTDETGKVWLWNASNRIGIVIKNL